jgi:hypothetical protein
MVVIGFIFAAIIVILAVFWLYRKISVAKKYAKAVGEIINVKNVVPLVDKTQILKGGNYLYTDCKYHGDVYVTVKFINREGEEITRRYNSFEPLHLKINEHKRSVPMYTSVFPEWKLGKRVKVFYDPTNTLDIFVGKVPRNIS